MTLYKEIEKEFDEKFNALISFGESQTGVSERENLKSFLRSALRKQAEAMKGVLEDTALADGFVGFSDEEWQGVKKILPLLVENLRSKFLPPETKEDKCSHDFELGTCMKCGIWIEAK